MLAFFLILDNCSNIQRKVAIFYYVVALKQIPILLFSTLKKMFPKWGSQWFALFNRTSFQIRV